MANLKKILSIDGGYQIGPRQHKVTATQADTVSDIYYRVSGFIAVDIPLLNFYTKSR